VLEARIAFQIGDGSWDGYTFTCRAHAELVLAREPGCISEPGRGVQPDPDELGR
jgi:hypothetical protein